MSRLIIIEGIDGSGKTTLANELRNTLNEKYKLSALFLSKKSVDASTPFQQAFMKNIRRSIWQNAVVDPVNEIDEETWLYLHMLWYHMLESFVIKNKFYKYDYLIMDGWYYKFLARHIVNNKIDIETSEQMLSKLINGDVVFLLNAPSDICLKRKNGVKLSECGVHKNNIKDSMGDSFCKYQDEVFDAYKSLKQKHGFIDIDSSGTIEESIKQMVKELGI